MKVGSRRYILLEEMASSTFCVIGLSVILGMMFHAQGEPLVYPNRFSFQKTTTTTSTTPPPEYDHDHSNLSFGNTLSTESGLPSSYRFRYGIAAFAIGALIVICVIFFFAWPKKTRWRSQSTCYSFPSNEAKGDADVSQVIIHPASASQ